MREGEVFLRNTNVPNGKRNVAYGNSKNQGPSALGTKPFSIRNKNGVGVGVGVEKRLPQFEEFWN